MLGSMICMDTGSDVGGGDAVRTAIWFASVVLDALDRLGWGKNWCLLSPAPVAPLPAPLGHLIVS